MTPDAGYRLALFTIYQSPADYPNKFVVRRWLVGASKGNPRPSHATEDVEPFAIVDTLDQARRALPFGLINLFRDDDDEPQIVETWV